jgi:hypothetical protein
VLLAYAPKQEFEHLTLRGSKYGNYAVRHPERDRGRNCRRIAAFFEFATPEKRIARRPSASSWAKIARDIYGMILGDMVGRTAESLDGNAAGQGVTYALGNRWHPAAETSSGTALKYSNSP